jgi:hypothetical protein
MPPLVCRRVPSDNAAGNGGGDQVGPGRLSARCLGNRSEALPAPLIRLPMARYPSTGLGPALLSEGSRRHCGSRRRDHAGPQLLR